jgi:hypothetical protein
LSGVFSLPGSHDLGADCVIAGDHLQSDWLFEECHIALASDGFPILRHKKRTSFWVFFSFCERINYENWILGCRCSI